MIKAIIFDVYGTLISTGTGSVDAAAEILRRKNSVICPKEFYARWKKIHKALTLEDTSNMLAHGLPKYF